MSEAEPVAAEIQEPRALTLDPFGFHAGVASRIEGLGGTSLGQDPTYVFHTHYVHTGQGPAEFSVRFDNLRAKRGTLVLRVHMLADEPGAHARLANSSRISLNRLVFQGGSATIGFEGFKGVTYALYATIPDESDVSADGVTVVLARPEQRDAEEQIFIDARTTSFSAPTHASAKLLSVARPSFAALVSQSATKHQLRDPIAQKWLREIGSDPALDTDSARWEAAYLLQALRCYGMLNAGAQGLWFGMGNSPLPAMLAQRGISVVATISDSSNDAYEQAHTRALQQLQRPNLCAPGTFTDQVDVRLAPHYPVPRNLVNFDFLWSSGVANSLGAISAGVRFIDEAMACLRPGGLAVHMMELNLTSHMSTVESDELTLFRRGDVERAAVILVSRNHEVAQISIDDRGALTKQVRDPTSGMRYAAASFGFVARKQTSAL